MSHLLEYNVNMFIYNEIEVSHMTLDNILSQYHPCKRYELNASVANYLKYIEAEPFYIPPTFNDVKPDPRISTVNPKFILFSAPGATGKSALAKYIANKYTAPLWDLSKLTVGTNSFAGSVLSAVGAANYSSFIGDLNSGNVILVIDAFDEAEIISGHKMIDSFIFDISNSLTAHVCPSVVLLARTETAQYLATYCANHEIPISHYEIGFFEETSAKDFIVKCSLEKGKLPQKPDIECADAYYDVIKCNISSIERTSFLGYAPVLQAISAHIKQYPNKQKLISALSTQTDCVSIIMKILDDLLDREAEEKVIPAFTRRCMEKYPDFSEWDKLYSPIEQLVRVIYYILFHDTSYDNYPLDFLPAYLIDDYQGILESFLPQHPFVRSFTDTDSPGSNVDFTGPAFRDYALARIILFPEHSSLANMYFEESQSKSFFPSQIFFDCYAYISKNVIHPEHITYVYDSYRAKATIYKRPYLQCSEVDNEDDGEKKCIAIFGMSGASKRPGNDETYIAEVLQSAPLHFDQLTSVSIDTPNHYVSIGHSGISALINNSSIICKGLEWKTKSITIESYAPEGCLLVAHEGFTGENVTIDITSDALLKVSAPNIKSYYKLIRYAYDFEDAADYDITKFIHALRCIFVEFRTHKKDTLAKSAERIDFVTVGNSEIKKKALDYLKYCGIIYTSDHLYKIDEKKMQEKRIHFNALSRMDTVQMDPAFKDFCQWLKSPC